MALPKHLTESETEAFGSELDAIRNEVMDSRGARDRRYIMRVIRAQRALALGGRLISLASVLALPGLGLSHGLLPLLGMLGLGVLLLGLAKIIENMEIGHNVMHAQWDWMHDPAIQSSSWEWDTACPSEMWKHSHNVVHHTWTNVIGKDPDVGYGILRVTPEQTWRSKYLFQPLGNLLLMLLFEWGVALHDLEPEKLMLREKTLASVRPMLRLILRKAARQLLKDYVLWPVLTAAIAMLFALSLGQDARGVGLAAFGWIAGANVLANLLRNVWSNMIIFCGHFSAGVHHFSEADVAGETRARWYVRQLLASCNIEGGGLFHLLSGNLSHQIEHHLFPDMPSNRYPEIAPRVRALAERYQLPYNSGSLSQQFGSTTWAIWKLAVPSAARLAGR